MFKIFSILLIVCFLGACKKKETAPNTTPTTPTSPVAPVVSNSFVKFTLLGTQRTLDAKAGSTFTKCYIENNELHIKAQSLNAGGNFGFEVKIENANPTTSSYNVLSSPTNLFKLFSVNEPINTRIGTDYLGTYGTITITKTKDIGGGIVVVNGTFSGVALNSIDGTLLQITDGQFYDNRTE